MLYMDRHYTVKEMAEVYRVSMYTIRKWAREGKIESVRIGKRWLFKDATIANVPVKSQ